MKTITFGRILRLAANKYLVYDNPGAVNKDSKFTCLAINSAARELGLHYLDACKVEHMYGHLSGFEPLTYVCYVVRDWDVDTQIRPNIQLQRFMHLYLMAQIFGDLRIEIRKI